MTLIANGFADDAELSSSRSSSRFLAWRSSTPFIVLVACTAVFTDVYVYGIVVPALPYLLQTLLQVDREQTQGWVTILLSTYGVANIAASPFFGYVADRGETRFGTFITALLAMAVSVVLFAISTSKLLIVFARLLQGIAAAGVWTVALAVVVDTVEQDKIGTAMGYISLAMTSGNVLGPMSGGVLFEIDGLRALTLTAGGLVFLTIIGRLTMVEVQASRKKKTDASLSNSIQHGGLYGTFPNDSYHDVENAASCSILSGDDEREGTTRTGMLSLLTTRRFIVIMVAICASSAFYSAFDTILPLHTIRTFHWSPTGSGLIFLPLSMPTLLSPLLGRVVDRFGTRVVAVTGFAGALPCFVALSFVSVNTLEHKILICAALFGAGLSLITQMVPLMTEVSKVVDRKDSGVGDGSVNGSIATGYALFNAAYASGILVGALVGGVVVERAGWRVVCLLLGTLSAVAGIPLWLIDDFDPPVGHDQKSLLSSANSIQDG